MNKFSNETYSRKVKELEEQGISTSDAQGIVDAEEIKINKIINMNNNEIDDLAEEALNIACLTIQNSLNINDGGYASIVFSDNEVKEKFIEYIKGEIQNKVNEL